jgi:hypothetical protein
MATTIDITPTGEELIRIYAYVLGVQADMSPLEFMKDYWNVTEAESEVIANTYNAFDQFHKALKSAGLSLSDTTQTFRTKLIKKAFETAKAGK